MSTLTPFHSWTEYWKAKEIVDSTYQEARSKDSQFLVCETSEMIDRIREWEKRHATALSHELSATEFKERVLRGYPGAFIGHIGNGYAVYENSKFNILGFGNSISDTWEDAYKNIKEKEKI